MRSRILIPVSGVICTWKGVHIAARGQIESGQQRSRLRCADRLGALHPGCLCNKRGRCKCHFGRPLVVPTYALPLHRHKQWHRKWGSAVPYVTSRKNIQSTLNLSSRLIGVDTGLMRQTQLLSIFRALFSKFSTMPERQARSNYQDCADGG